VKSYCYGNPGSLLFKTRVNYCIAYFSQTLHRISQSAIAKLLELRNVLAVLLQKHLLHNIIKLIELDFGICQTTPAIIMKGRGEGVGEGVSARLLYFDGQNCR